MISRKQQQIDRLTLCPEVFFLSSVENFLSQSSFPGSFLSDVCVQDEELSPCLLNLSVKRFPFCGLSPQFNWAIGGWQKKNIPPPHRKKNHGPFAVTKTPGVVFLYTKRGENIPPSSHREYDKLGGRNSNIFYFHPEIWGRFPI